MMGGHHLTFLVPDSCHLKYIDKNVINSTHIFTKTLLVLLPLLLLLLDLFVVNIISLVTNYIILLTRNPITI